MKKDQNSPNKNIHSNNGTGKSLPNISKYSRNLSLYNSNYRGRSPNQKNSHNFSQTDIVNQIVEIYSIKTTIHDQNQTD